MHIYYIGSLVYSFLINSLHNCNSTNFKQSNPIMRKYSYVCQYSWIKLCIYNCNFLDYLLIFKINQKQSVINGAKLLLKLFSLGIYYFIILSKRGLLFYRQGGWRVNCWKKVSWKKEYSQKFETNILNAPIIFPGGVNTPSFCTPLILNNTINIISKIFRQLQ